MRTGTDRAGRGAGIVVFFVGAGLLLVVFFLAYTELIASGALAAAPAAAPPPAANVALLVATKGLFLFVMGFAASAIANKGIGLYQAAVHAEDQ